MYHYRFIKSPIDRHLDCFILSKNYYYRNVCHPHGPFRSQALLPSAAGSLPALSPSGPVFRGAFPALTTSMHEETGAQRPGPLASMA